MAKRAAATPATKKKRGAASVAAAKATKTTAATPPKRPPRTRASNVPAAAAAKKTQAPDPLPSDPTPLPPKNLSSISDLRDLASSGIDTFKRRLDTMHVEAIKEINASVSHVSKKFKAQAQAWQQLAEESEKEYITASDKINENAELAKGSFGELISKAQAEANRVRKVSIPELEKSMEKAIGYLRSQYRIPATTA